MSKVKRKADERLDRRIKSYEDTINNKRVDTSGFHKPGSQKKVH